ncbi:hypothetical protein [Psychromicrobium sp. YIM B11713]|uniref:hypothetical protein n=1 Tax=Psychromicrobium sp. YIM B11713 TaxID=3145233 RepID=UPI00374F3AA7
MDAETWRLLISVGITGVVGLGAAGIAAWVARKGVADARWHQREQWLLERRYEAYIEAVERLLKAVASTRDSIREEILKAEFKDAVTYDRLLGTKFRLLAPNEVSQYADEVLRGLQLGWIGLTPSGEESLTFQQHAEMSLIKTIDIIRNELAGVRSDPENG